MISGEYNMVIADRLCQEVGGLRLVYEMNDLLGATEIGLYLTLNQFSLCYEIAREIA